MFVHLTRVKTMVPVSQLALQQHSVNAQTDIQAINVNMPTHVIQTHVKIKVLVFPDQNILHHQIFHVIV